MHQDDPVVQRVRTARREILEECGGDPHKLYEWAKAIEEEHKDRLVRYDPAKRRLDKVD